MTLERQAMNCKYHNCKDRASIVSNEFYQHSLPLCARHWNELSKLDLGSDAERRFLIMCGAVTSDAAAKVADELMKVL